MGSDRKINMKKFAKDVETTISAMRSGELGDDFALELVDDLQKQFPIEKVERLLKAYRSGSIKSIKILSDLLDSEYKNHLPEEKVANKKSKSRKSNRVIEIEDNDLDDDGFEFRRDFRRHFRFQLPYPLAESKVMSFKINGMVRKGKPLSNFIVLVVAVDINGVMHILDDTGKELAYLPLDHHSRLTAISYDGTDFNCPLIVTAAEDGSIHSIHLNVFRNGYLVGGARQMPVIDNDNIASPGGEGIAPKEIKRDSESVYTIQAYIHSKYRLPSLESTSQEGHCSVGDDGIEQCSTPHSALDSDSNPNSASASTSNLKAGQLTNKKGVDIGPYVTSMLINHKSVKDGHIVYAGDSEGRYFQLSARDGKVARHMVVSKGERIQASIRTGYSLAIVTGKNISFFQINKFTRSPIKCVAPQPIIDVQYDTRLASNVLAKLTTGEIVVFSTVKSRTLKNEQDLNEDTDIKSPSTICHIVKILKAETDHPVSKLVETYTSSPHVKKTDAVITPGTFFNVRGYVVSSYGCDTYIFNTTRGYFNADFKGTLDHTSCHVNLPKPSIDTLPLSYASFAPQGFGGIRIDTTVPPIKSTTGSSNTAARNIPPSDVIAIFSHNSFNCTGKMKKQAPLYSNSPSLKPHLFCGSIITGYKLKLPHPPSDIFGDTLASLRPFLLIFIIFGVVVYQYCTGKWNRRRNGSAYRNLTRKARERQNLGGGSQLDELSDLLLADKRGLDKLDLASIEKLQQEIERLSSKIPSPSSS